MNKKNKKFYLVVAVMVLVLIGMALLSSKTPPTQSTPSVIQDPTPPTPGDFNANNPPCTGDPKTCI
jgi:hypothetical protein